MFLDAKNARTANVLYECDHDLTFHTHCFCDKFSFFVYASGTCLANKLDLLVSSYKRPGIDIRVRASQTVTPPRHQTVYAIRTYVSIHTARDTVEEGDAGI